MLSVILFPFFSPKIHNFGGVVVALFRDESVVDNEGMGRKSSKRCCIFHKPRAFGESSTDTSDYDSDNENGKYNSKKIAHKKLPAKKKLPDHLRFHA